MKENRKPVKTSLALICAINNLKTALAKEYGCDYAFTIMGRGYIVAASNYVDGIVMPERTDLWVDIKWLKTEQKVRFSSGAWQNSVGTVKRYDKQNEKVIYFVIVPEGLTMELCVKPEEILEFI